MLDHIDITSNEQFHRLFKRMNLIWLVVAIGYISATTVAVLVSTPAYLHDWRGAVIIGLSLLLALTYYARIFLMTDDWPPSWRMALSLWLGMYILIVILTIFDNNLSYDFYFLFGISFTLFNSRRLILSAVVITLTIFVYQGLLTLPIELYKVIGIVGEGMAMVSMTAIGLLSQHLIYERYDRNNLLQQLTQTNADLAEAHQHLAQSAAQEQELAVLRERTRLAREVHDTLGHALVLISVKLEVAQRLRELDPERCDRELEATKEIVRDSMKELRASIANLRSPALEHESACRAISRYAQEMAQRAGLHVAYDLHPDIEGLPEPVEETLWKVGQEALTNVEKHAQASNVILHISRQKGHILLKVQDDGIGLPRELCTLHTNNHGRCVSPEGHYGLSGMFERIENIGGRINLKSGFVSEQGDVLERGTTIEVQIPLVEALQ